MRRAACAVLDLLYPRACASCGEVIAEPDGSQMCALCTANLPLVTGPACRRCGLPLGPFALDHEGRWCEGCRTLPLAAFRRTVAVGSYEGVLRRAVASYKYGRRPHLARTLSALLVGRAVEAFAGDAAPDVVVSVPLHPSRRRWRTFDQAELLAAPVAAALGVPLARGALRRAVDTPTLTRLSRAERAETVKGAFRVAKPRDVEGRRVLLVDDVMTTGVTCSECARALKAAGATEVVVAVLARTA